MFGLGKLLVLPVRILNVPMALVDAVMDVDDEKGRVFSAPLEAVAEVLEEAIDGKD